MPWFNLGAQVIRKGTEPNPERTRILELQSQSRGKGEIPQVIGFVQDEACSEFREDGFKWGHDLLDVLNNKQVMLSEDRVCVFERLKMVLYPVQDTREVVQEINMSLERTGLKKEFGLTPHRLIEMHLKHIRAAAMESTIQKFRSTSWSEEEIRAMDIKTFFTVPEISTEATVHILQQLLVSAGFQKTVALTETEAAGAWRSYELLSENYELPFRFKVSSIRLHST